MEIYDIYGIANNLENMRLRLLTKDAEMRVELKELNNFLDQIRQLNIIHIQKEINTWIEELSKYGLTANNSERLARDLKDWKNDITGYLQENFYLVKTNTVHIKKSNLKIGIGAFLEEDIRRRLSANDESDLNDAIKCILCGPPTPAVMVTFRVSEDIIRLYYEKKTQNSSKGMALVNVIDELLKLSNTNIKKPLVGYLHYIRDRRNEAEHPGKVYTQEECELTFLQTIDLIKNIYKQI